MQMVSPWERNLQERITEMFPLFHQKSLTFSADITSLIVSHLVHLQDYFRMYFLDLDNAHLNWIRDPFVAATETHLYLTS